MLLLLLLLWLLVTFVGSGCSFYWLMLFVVVLHVFHVTHNFQADTGLEYDRYLREVVSILEEDEKFRQKLENTSIDDIKTGAIAHQLEYVSHHIRTKLDELKRKEVGRLRELARQKRAVDKMGKVAKDDKLFPNHIDHSNPHTFETEDLKKGVSE